MFAVPGWSVPADKLKTETAVRAPATDRAPKRPVVTAANVGDLWKVVVEGGAHKGKKRQSGGTNVDADADANANADVDADAPARKRRRERKKGKRKAAEEPAASDGPIQEPSKALEHHGPSFAIGVPGEGVAAAAAASKKRKRSSEPREKSSREGAITSEPKQTHKSKARLLDPPPIQNTDKAASRHKKNNFVPENESGIDPVKGKEKTKKGEDHQQKRDSNAEIITRSEANKPVSSSNRADAPQHPFLHTPLPPPSADLTPLQQSMRNKLVSARFRYLNEMLYSRPSTEAQRMFNADPDLYTQYHEGFRRQVRAWPENPAEGYARLLLERAAAVPALPRTAGVCTVADLGCGDAVLARTAAPHASRLRLTVHSFDLQGAPPLVTCADLAELPLADRSVDVAVFCLALMGTNWVRFVDEASRVLRPRGELWVAEVQSRFVAPAPSLLRPRDHHRRPRVVKEDVEDDEVEGDGEDDGGCHRRGGVGTDLSGFVEVLRRRGFVLRGEPDLSNKMVVKMVFAKSTGRQQETAVRVEDEGAVLKPCVYKLR